MSYEDLQCSTDRSSPDILDSGNERMLVLHVVHDLTHMQSLTLSIDLSNLMSVCLSLSVCNNQSTR